MHFLSTLDGLLDHIKAVERETIDLTKEAHLRMAGFIQTNALSPDDGVLEAMQYQDIISQQLTATIEAIESVQGHLREFSQAMEAEDGNAAESIGKMHSRLSAALEKAQQQHSAFGGKLQHDDDDGIEFF